jgi:hypothetical protein
MQYPTGLEAYLAQKVVADACFQAKKSGLSRFFYSMPITRHGGNQ